MIGSASSPISATHRPRNYGRCDMCRNRPHPWGTRHRLVSWAVSFMLCSFYQYFSVHSFIYTQPQECNKQDSCWPWRALVGGWLSLTWENNRLHYASVLWWTCLQCIHVHRHRVRKMCCRKNSQSHVSGRHRDLATRAVKTAKLAVILLLSSRVLPSTQCQHKELVRELGGRRRPTVVIIPVGTRSSASSDQITRDATCCVSVIL